MGREKDQAAGWTGEDQQRAPPKLHSFLLMLFLFCILLPFRSLVAAGVAATAGCLVCVRCVFSNEWLVVLVASWIPSVRSVV